MADYCYCEKGHKYLVWHNGCPECGENKNVDKRKTQTDYNRKCLARQAEAGWVRVSVMLPRESVDKFKALAKKEREK